MIEINLLPQELQVKAKKASTGPKVDVKNFLIGIPIIFALLIIAHIFLALGSISLNLKASSLEKKWNSLAGQRKELDNLKKEYNVFTQDAAISSQLTKGRTAWGERLNLLSLKLPSGIWFNELLITNKDFVLRGAVVSLVKQELTLINKFLASLKETPQFFNNFTSLEMGSVQREVVGGYDILNFSLNGVLK